MKSWKEYALRWQESKAFAVIEDRSISSREREAYLQALGDEWGTKVAVDEFVNDFIAPNIGESSVVLELGSGGGRVAGRVAPKCRRMICADVEEEMLQLCRKNLKHLPNVEYCTIAVAPPRISLGDGLLDLLYSFDTLVHLDQRTVDRYFTEAVRLLRPGGRMVAHLATHETEAGWKHFIESVTGEVTALQFGSFEYVDSHAVIRMAEKAGLKCLETSLGRLGNFYYERDVVYLLEKTV